MENTYEKKTDEQLVLLAQDGDGQAIESLLCRYSALVRRCVRVRGFFLIGGENDDLIQEGMIGLYNAIIKYETKREGGRNFKNFAEMCITRRLIDAVKASTRKKNGAVIPLDTELVGNELSPEDMIILSDENREFRQKMSKVLSDFEFKITTMYVDGMSCEEICEATGKPPKSIDNAIQRSKKKLQEIYKK